MCNVQFTIHNANAFSKIPFLNKLKTLQFFLIISSTYEHGGNNSDSVMYLCNHNKKRESEFCPPIIRRIPFLKNSKALQFFFSFFSNILFSQ